MKLKLQYCFDNSLVARFFHCFFERFFKHFFGITEALLGFAKRIWPSGCRRFSADIPHPHSCLGRHLLWLIVIEYSCQSVWASEVLED